MCHDSSLCGLTLCEQTHLTTTRSPPRRISHFTYGFVLFCFAWFCFVTRYFHCGMTHYTTHTATHCRSLQLTATHCNSLQLTATCVSCQRVCIAQRAATPQRTAPHCITLHHTAPHCTTLHHTAPHCTTLHHTAPHCTTFTATHSNTGYASHNALCASNGLW